MSKNEKLSPYKRTILELKKAMKKSKMQLKHVQFDCSHRGKNGKFYIKQSKKNKDVWKCKECGRKINLAAIKDKDRKELKSDINKMFKGSLNYIEISKLLMNPKHDSKAAKLFSKTERYLEYARRMVIASIGEEFEPHKKNKKNKGKGKKNRGISFSSGGKSLGL
jgi:ribosomal protein L37AE/L43A